MTKSCCNEDVGGQYNTEEVLFSAVGNSEKFNLCPDEAVENTYIAHMYKYMYTERDECFAQGNCSETPLTVRNRMELGIACWEHWNITGNPGKEGKAECLEKERDPQSA